MSRKNGKYLTCTICGKEYYAVHARTNSSKYCSRECWSKRNPPKKEICYFCGNEFITYQRNQTFCSIKCRIENQNGKELSDETKIKMSESKQGYMPVNVYQKGEKHPFWKKDRSMIALTETPEYNEFRLTILKRDNYTCQKCKIRGKKGIRPILEIHHIKTKTEYPELAMDGKNCITLCHDCHKKTDSYLNRWIIDRMLKLDPTIQIKRNGEVYN